MTEQVFLSLGSNLGDRRAALEEALALLRQRGGVVPGRRSSVIETAPWGVTDQPAFLNLVAEATTALDPFALLAEAKAVEAALGRVPGRRWGPRRIDVDIVLYGRWRVAAADLVIPHRHAPERRFVMDPLREIAPDVAAMLEAGTWTTRDWPGGGT